MWLFLLLPISCDHGPLGVKSPLEFHTKGRLTFSLYSSGAPSEEAWCLSHEKVSFGTGAAQKNLPYFNNNF